MGERKPACRVLRLLGALLFCFVLASGSGSAALAAEVETHEFSAELSLTGGCGTTTLDPVPDPPISECNAGTHPPSGTFTSPRSIAPDPHGDIYVANYGKESASGAEGRIDIFDPGGFFITEVAALGGPKSIAVDSKGNIYALEHGQFGRRVCRYSPTTYKPLTSEISYGSCVVLVEQGEVPANAGVAINPENDNLFLHKENKVAEFGSAAEGNPLLDNTIGEGILSNGKWVAIDAAHEKIYASYSEELSSNSKIKVFELKAPHKLLATFDGSTTPEGKFITIAGNTPVAVEEETGNFFVYDPEASPPRVDEFTAPGEYLGKFEHGFQYAFCSDIKLDNSPASKNRGTLFVPSGLNGLGHSYAFVRLSQHVEPEVESISFANITEEEAELRAKINPGGLETGYTFEYTTQESFEEKGFAGASLAGKGAIPVGGEGVEVFAEANGLLPGTTYRFRISAENEKGSDEKSTLFNTYLAPPPPRLCSNDGFRTEASAALPDCRAYELVTPADTNGRTPSGVGIGFTGDLFPTTQASPAGERVSFVVEGGSLPGSEGTGSFHGDPYLASRTAMGWSTSHVGPSGEETATLLPGSPSPDQGYSFWAAGGSGGGSAVIGKMETHYVRYPDGHVELVGRGSLGVDPRAFGDLITAGGDHIVFSTNNLFEPAVKLEENAPPDGTEAIYDRTAEEETHVVSLLPGNVTPSAGQNAEFIGASLDGKGVAFTIGKELYLRFNNEETYEIGEGATFAGIAEGGARIFFVKGGDLFAFDAEEEQTIRFTEAGDVTPVNVAADGTAAYFVSPSVLTEEENPNETIAQKGAENLYLSREGAISFVGTVTERDVKGEFASTLQVDGLGLWTAALKNRHLGVDPSRTTPDGSALLFESRADLAGYDPEGHAEVYRYDATNKELECLSCNPTLSLASGEASLESVAVAGGALEPFGPSVLVPNLRADGRRAFFQSSEPLVPTDTDGLQDVYEWEAQGVGSCERPEGCVHLISSGHSTHVDYLYAVSASGNDVFFRTSDLLLPADKDGTPSIYDARVGGGFPEGEEEECEGEGCRPTLTPPPILASPGTPAPGAEDNIVPPKRCPKGKHRVTKNGETRCVKNKKKHHRHHRAGAKKGAGK